jgi:RimJ/RimL family protein N-acetyltransferase
MIVHSLNAGDRSTVVRLHANLSERSRRLRFLGPKPELSQVELDRLAATDGHDHVALVAIEDEQPVAICRFVRDSSDESTAEFACAVADDYQRRGIGTSLAGRLADRARELGIHRFRATVLSTNRAGLKLVRGLGPVERTRFEGTTLELLVELSGAQTSARYVLRTSSLWRSAFASSASAMWPVSIT